MKSVLGHLTSSLAANIWASASTFLLFVVVSRLVDATELGRFTLALALSQAAVQLIDGGYSPLLIREANKSGQEPLAVLAWGLRNRIVRVGLALPIVSGILALVSWSPSAILAVDALVVGSVLYGFSLIVQQATHRRTAYTVSLFSNGVLYTVVAGIFVALPAHTRSLAVLISGPAVVLFVIGIGGTRHIFSAEPARNLSPADSRYFNVTVVANTVTANADTVLLGAINPGIAGRYAMNQRPAYALVPLSTGLSAVALPRLAASNRAERDRVRGWLPAFLPLPPLIGVVAFLSVPPVLDVVYGRGGSVQPLVIAFLFAGYAFGMVSQLSSSLLVMRHQTRVVATTAIIQMLIVVAVTGLGVASGAIVVVALGILLSRLLLVAWQVAVLFMTSANYDALATEQA